MICLTRFQEHLVILSGCSNMIRFALDSFPTSKVGQHSDLKFTLANYLHIQLCCFMEEWQRLEGMGHDTAIRQTLRVVSPAIRRIRQWPNLRIVRSQLLAHPARDSEGRFAPPWRVFGMLSAPTTYAETILLGNCALAARDTLLRRHIDDWEKASSYLESQDRHIEDKGIRSIAEAKRELAAIVQQIAQREALYDE